MLAPGLKLEPAGLNQVRHHVLLAHGLAVATAHGAGTKVGPSEARMAVPAIDAPEHKAASRDACAQRSVPGVILEGKYNDAYLVRREGCTQFTDADSASSVSFLDFVGINVGRTPTCACRQNEPDT